MKIDSNAARSDESCSECSDDEASCNKPSASSKAKQTAKQTAEEASQDVVDTASSAPSPSKSARPMTLRLALPKPAQPAPSRAVSPPTLPSPSRRSGRWDPPITQRALSQIDYKRLKRNFKFRLDIHFDPDVRAKTNAARATRRCQHATSYWEAFRNDLAICRYHLQTAPPISRKILNQTRIPNLLTCVRQIMLSMSPAKLQWEIGECLDQDLVTQEIAHGAYSLRGLAAWLERYLRTQCAPMRDDQLHELARALTEGEEQDDMLLVCDGLEKLLVFLETMKLDRANNFIRVSRMQLIDDTEDDLRPYIESKVRDESDAYLAAHSWFEGLRGPAVHASNLQRFVFGTARLCGSKPMELPSTFHWDAGRFDELREDVARLVETAAITRVFDAITKAKLGPLFVPAEHHPVLTKRIAAATEESDDEWSPVEPRLRIISTEVCRLAASVMKVPVDDALDDRVYRQLEGAMEERNMGRVEAHTLFELGHAAWTFLRQFETKSMGELAAKPRADASEPAGLEDVARRLAHLCVINWRLWAEPVYLNSFSDSP